MIALKHTAIFIAIALLFSILISGSAAMDARSINITDCIGRNTTVPAEINRVISLNADATRIVVSLGAGDRIVGVDSYSLRCPILNKTYPRLKEVKDVGSHISGTLSMESLASLKPDVILLSGSSKDLADKIQAELGIPCVCTYFNVSKVDDFLSAYEVLGELMGKKERSRDIQSFIRNKINGIINVSSAIPKDQYPRVITIGQPLSNDPFKIVTVSSVIDWAGGINAGADSYKGGSPSKVVAIEQIAKWDPDMIFINGLALIDVDTILNDPNWKQLRAVKEGKVYKIYSAMVGYDPAIFMVQPMNLAKIMHPDRYTFDFQEEADKVFEKIYGISKLHPIFEAEFGISNV
ncbi:Vitamin B12-binding protein [uncultured archaeon]|nr:Vitamin B12-binding protein [uncultured archaeon]